MLKTQFISLQTHDFYNRFANSLAQQAGEKTIYENATTLSRAATSFSYGQIFY